MKVHHYQKHNESVALEESKCKRCGENFEYYPSEKEGLYCEECVDNKWGNENLIHKSGKENPNYNSEQVFCEFCESEIEVKKSIFDKQNRHFCNRSCYGKWRSSWQEEENNPNYVDGREGSELYAGSWSRVRKSVLERDNYSCLICDKSKSEIGRNPDVHHIKPVRSFEDPDEAHKSENLICLCPECHSEVESGGSVAWNHIGLPTEVKKFILEESR